MTPAFWRRWHRWIGAPAAAFLLFASGTGMFLAGTEFFGEDEALREATRDQISTVTLASRDQVSAAVDRALSTAAAQAPGAPVDKIEMQFKGDAPTIAVFTGKPTGGEDRKFVMNANTGALLRSEAYVDKPFINRLHSGEAFGDGGLVAAMFWAFALMLLTISGFAIFWRMRRTNVTGWRRYFF
jgi:uncharacterized iron-regulated membrane protein